jgi:hypothetical protein
MRTRYKVSSVKPKSDFRLFNYKYTHVLYTNILRFINWLDFNYSYFKIRNKNVINL